MMLTLDAPDSPGWWAFEGSEWESKPIYVVNGVTYDEWQEKWNEEAEEYWHRHEMNLIEPDHYVPVPGVPFWTVLDVKWVHPGMSIHTRNSSGPHSGEKVLGFVSNKYRWNHALYTPDTLVGKWTKVLLPWDEEE